MEQILKWNQLIPDKKVFKKPVASMLSVFFIFKKVHPFYEGKIQYFSNFRNNL